MEPGPDRVDALARKPLGELLIERGKLDAQALERALRLQEGSGEKLGQLLVTLGLVAQRDVAEALAAQLALPLVDASGYPEFPILEERVSARFLRESRALPIREDETELSLAMADPTDAYTIGAFEMVTGRTVRPLIAIPTELEAALERLYGSGKSAQSQIIGDVETRVDELAFDADVQQLKDLASEAPVIRLVSLLITNALEMRASDIHVEPFENRLHVRYRIDGVLHDVESPPKRLSAAVISRIKIMANLDIAERRLPQDGRIRLRVQGKEIDLRVSTVPTMHGESVVMRILDKGGVALDFDRLGFESDTLKRFLEALMQPHGILLVTGPTGSGKTTTLYTALDRLNQPDVKILGVEDYLLTSTIVGILAQRLVRTLCPHCKETYTALPELVEEINLRRFTDAKDITLWHAKGCSHCANTGYIGRISILEMLPITDTLRSMVMKHATATDLRAESVREGMLTMYEDGLRKALKGVTTFEEVLRVTREN